MFSGCPSVRATGHRHPLTGSNSYCSKRQAHVCELGLLPKSWKAGSRTRDHRVASPVPCLATLHHQARSLATEAVKRTVNIASLR